MLREKGKGFDMNGKERGRASGNVRKRLFAILVIVFFVGAVGTLWQQADYWKGAGDYAKAEMLAGLEGTGELEKDVALELEGESKPGKEEDPYAKALAAIDLEGLQAVNSDVIGWILIPDTVISYPMLYSGDNSYYLERTWLKEESSVGSIFLDYRNHVDLRDYNTLIYGHRMKDDSMFGSLGEYASYEYWKEHPNVYLADAQGVYRYEIFSAYEVSVVGSAYQLDFPDDGAKQTFLDDCRGYSLIDTGKVPSVEERVITLSTCTGRGYATRWVVQASLKEEFSVEE